MLALRKSFRDFSMLAAKDHFQSAINKKSLSQKLLNLILVDRNASPLETRRLIKECEQATFQNKHLIIYPEGTRSIDGNVNAFKPGSVYIAHKLNLPIVPAAIKGSHIALAKNSWFIRPHKIKVHFGEPILPGDFPNKNQKQILQQLTKELENKINNLMQKMSGD